MRATLDKYWSDGYTNICDQCGIDISDRYYARMVSTASQDYIVHATCAGSLKVAIERFAQSKGCKVTITITD